VSDEMHATEQERMEALQELRRLGVADEAPGVYFTHKISQPLYDAVALILPLYLDLLANWCEFLCRIGMLTTSRYKSAPLPATLSCFSSVGMIGVLIRLV
jgi:hypothetical protein